MTTSIRKRKKYIKTNSRTNEVRTRVHPRINKNALVFFVLEKAYPKKLDSAEVQIELAKDGINLSLTQISSILIDLSGNNKSVVARLRRNEFTCHMKNGVKLYRFNPSGNIKIKPVALSYSRNDLVTEAVFV